MIRVERGEAPGFINDDAFVSARGTYERFKQTGGSRGKQTLIDFRTALGEHAKLATEYAYQLFNTKCAYTEATVAPLLHLHRPESNAYDERLEVASPDHYWWTAFWFGNWYHASAEIASLKRNTFPVIGGRATAPVDWRPGIDTRVPPTDDGVLLDPCVDHPQLHMLFDDEGHVTPWAQQPAPWLVGEQRRRGDETIKLLDLDNPRLVQARSTQMRLGYRVVDLVANPTIPHLGAVRQKIAAHRLADGRLDKELRELAPELVPHLLATPDRFSDRFVADVRRALQQQNHPDLAQMLAAPVTKVRDVTRERVPLPPPTTVAPPPPRVIPPHATIAKIQIKNFQAIESYELKIPAVIGELPLGDDEDEVDEEPTRTEARAAPQPEFLSGEVAKRPWRAFLGENGSGKSSVLRAVALALAGNQVSALVRQGKLRWSDLLRRDTTDGQVRIDFDTGDFIDLKFTSRGPTPESRRHLPDVTGFIRGFGATHVKSESQSTPAGNVRLGNLFDPLQPVVDAQKWLVGLDKNRPGDFNVAAITIAKLLQRHEEVADTGDPNQKKFLTVEDDEILVAGDKMRLLSDGYRAIISLACDLMAGSGGGLSDMRYANGIVLIDELGCYLHPRWKMQITRTLRDEFTSIQFLVTTHEPLCLRGLFEREVERVKPSSTKVGEPWHSEFETIEQSPSDYRVDRLLTSDFFGLSTTIDPEVEKEFLEYYGLLRKAEPTDTERQRIADLRATLSKHGTLGYTARDLLIYDAIDRFLAKSTTLPADQRKRKREKTLTTIVDIWATVAAQRKVEPTSQPTQGPP